MAWMPLQTLQCKKEAILPFQETTSISLGSKAFNRPGHVINTTVLSDEIVFKVVKKDYVYSGLKIQTTEQQSGRLAATSLIARVVVWVCVCALDKGDLH